MFKKKFFGIMPLIAVVALIFMVCKDPAITGTSCSHVWEWVVTTAPTATEAGEETEICSLCGETGTKRPVPATPAVISSIAINLGAPVNGGIPVTTATTTEAGYTISTVSWLPDDNPFLGGTVYTATVTLTANSGYTFTGLGSATINGQNALISDNTGEAITLSYTFPATDERTVTDIVIKTQPAKLVYTHGDTLDLEGLVVTLTYEDTTTEDVGAADFTVKNITANPAQGNHLIHSTHNEQPVTITYGSLPPLTTNNLTVNPITFTVDPIPEQTYTGNAIVPSVTVMDGTAVLTLNTDYTVEYTDNTNAGTASVTINGAGNYAGSTGSAVFTINPKVITFTIDTILAQMYNGSALTPVITVRDGARVLTLTADYTVEYVNNINVGTAAVTITGAGNYAGSTGGTTFTINKAHGAVVNTPVLNTRTHNNITLNPVTTPTNGQTVEYAINTINTAPINGWQDGITFSGLNEGTTYYIFARTIENNNYQTGAASESLTVTTLQTVSPDRVEYYWVDAHGNLVTTSYGGTSVTVGVILTITAQGEGYDVKQWFLNGVNTGQSETTYNFSSTTVGQHILSLFVEKDGKPYNTNITIMVQ